jgi:hypothetical protein
MELVRAEEIRRLFKLSSNARVYELARRGVLPGVVRVGRQVRFDLKRILAFIDSGGQGLAGGWRREQNRTPPVHDAAKVTDQSGLDPVSGSAVQEVRTSGNN